MARRISKNISVLEFGCQAPLRFFEHCAACPRFEDDCPDLKMGKYYFERTRKKCGHAGRCREEGLLLALLDGKKALDYSRKEVTELPRRRQLRKVAKREAEPARKVSVP
jgi:hypothetical protein